MPMRKGTGASKWQQYIGESTIAIMDRLSGNAQRIDFKRESLRKKNNFEKND